MNHNNFIIPEGLLFIIPLGIITVVLAFAGMVWAAAIFFVAALFVTWFFRNPERKIPEDEKVVVSPADGKILKIEEVSEDTILNGKFKNNFHN